MPTVVDTQYVVAVSAPEVDAVFTLDGGVGGELLAQLIEAFITNVTAGRSAMPDPRATRKVAEDSESVTPWWHKYQASKERTAERTSGGC